MTTMSDIEKIKRNVLSIFPSVLAVMIAEYAVSPPQIDEEFYDGTNFDGFDYITQIGQWSSNFFVYVNDVSFIIGNYFSSCDHSSCGAFGDTDCEEDTMAVQVTVEQNLTFENLNNALSVLEQYVVQKEHGETPIVGCLYNVDTSVCEESLNLLRNLGFTGEIPKAPSFGYSDDDDNTDDADE